MCNRRSTARVSPATQMRNKPLMTQARDESRANRRRCPSSAPSSCCGGEWFNDNALSRRNRKRASSFVDVVPDVVLALDVEVRSIWKEPMRSDHMLEPRPSKVVKRTFSSKRPAASVKVDLAAHARAMHSPVVRSWCCSTLSCWPWMMQSSSFWRLHQHAARAISDSTTASSATPRACSSQVSWSLTHSTEAPLAESRTAPLLQNLKQEWQFSDSGASRLLTAMGVSSCMLGPMEQGGPLS